MGRFVYLAYIITISTVTAIAVYVFVEYLGRSESVSALAFLSIFLFFLYYSPQTAFLRVFYFLVGAALSVTLAPSLLESIVNYILTAVYESTTSGHGLSEQTSISWRRFLS